MSTPTNLREQLIRDEGLRLDLYTDSLGYYSIGVGRLLDTRKGGGISEEEAYYLLENDIEKFQNQLAAALPWALRLDPVRRAVLVNMVFNMGLGNREKGLLSFVNFLAAMEAGEWVKAKEHGLESVWHTQVGKRAERLMEQVVTGKWQ